MNANCYKIIFSKRLGTLVAVGEHTSSTGKAASGQGCRGSVVVDGFVGALRFTFASVAIACLSLGNTQAQSTLALASTALPQGGNVNTGSATISTHGAAMAITQTTDKASINWQSFNVGTAASVNIAQPSTDAVLLNRVVGNDPSQILGKLTANGQVILLNPNGVVFGKDGSVTASSFTASTFGLTDADFMAGYYKYNRNGSTAAVVNQGTIETSAGGFVALIGAAVTNEGTIRAHQGDVVLAAAETVTLPNELVKPQAPATPNTVSVRMSKRVRLELDPAAINTAVNNTESGVIVTEGGQVLLQAAALSSAVASVTHSGRIDTSAPQAGAVTVLAEGGVIKVDGNITANSSGTDSQGQTRQGGDIIIGRDEKTGALAKATDVSGAKLESQGGFVETSGHTLSVDGVQVIAKDWLLDPDNIDITGDATAATAGYSKIKASDIATALNAGTNVTVSTTAASSVNQPAYSDTAGTGAGTAVTGDGNILVNAAIVKSGSSNAGLTLLADNGITVSQRIGKASADTSSTGKLDVTLTARGNAAVATDSKGIVLGNVIDANGGAVTVSGTNLNTNANSIGVTFNNGSGITAGSYTVQGVSTSTAQQSYGVGMFGTVKFKSTGDSLINGTSLAQSTAMTYGTTIGDGANVSFDAGNAGGKLVVKGSNAAWETGLRISAGGGASTVTTDGLVTLGALEDKSQFSFRAGTITANSGSLTLLGQMTGAGTALSTYDGSSITANNGVSITMEGKITGTNTGTAVGLGQNSALTMQALKGTAASAGDIKITGTATNGTGVHIKNASNTTWQAKNITINGLVNTTAGATGYGVFFQRYANVPAFNASGNISVEGTVQGAGSGTGLTFEISGWGGQATSMTASGDITLRGNNRASTANTRNAVYIASGVQAVAGGNLVLQGETNNAATTAINVVSNAATAWGTALYGNMTLQATGNVLVQSNQGSIVLNNQLASNYTNGTLTTETKITGNNITIDNTGAGMATGAGTAVTGTGGTQGATLGSGSIDAVTGVITRGAGKSTSSTAGVRMADGRAITAKNNINIFGAGTSGSGVEISGAAALSANVVGYTGNINIAGENTSSSGAAINISNASSTITARNVTTLTSSGTGSGTSLVAAGNINVGGELQVENPATATISGVISGTGMLRKRGGTGTGTLTLTGDNSYTGGTTANGGTLQVGNGGTVGSLGTGAISITSVLNINRSDSYTIADNISGTGQLWQTGSGTTVLTGTNSYSGNTLVNAGILQVGNGGTTGTLGTSSVALSNTRLYFVRSNDISASNTVTGTGYVYASSSGGGVTLSNLALTANLSASALGNISITNTGGTLTVNDVNGVSGVSALGDISLSSTSSSGHGLYLLKNVTSTNGNVNLVGSTSSTTSSHAGVMSSAIVTGRDITMVANATANTGSVLGYYGAGGQFIASGNLSLSGSSSNAGNGLYSYGGHFESGTGMTLAGTSAQGNAVGMDANLTLINGASGGISVTGTSTDSTKNAISLRGTSVTNGGGAITMNATSGHFFADEGSSVWGLGTLTNTLNQNGSGNVTITTQNSGNLTAPIIVNNGSGNVVVAAGSNIAAGTGTGGQVLTVSGNTITQNSSGKTYIYSGSAGSTGVLSNLSSDFSSLYYQGTSHAVNTAFNKTYDGTPANDLTAPTGGSVTTGAQVFFRSTTKPGFSLAVDDVNKAYGDADPTSFSIIGGATTLTNAYAGIGGNNTFAVASADALAALTGTRVAGENVGSYAYTLDGSAMNATLSAQPDLNIVKRDITLTSVTAADKVYNGDTVATINGGLFGNLVGAETLSLSGAGVFADPNAGNSKTVSVTDATTLTQVDGTGLWSNYNLTTTGAVSGTGNITKAPLTLTVNNSSVFVTQNANSAPDNGFSYSGFLNGDTASVLTGNPTRTYTGAASYPVAGTYTGVLGASSLPTATNYLVTLAAGDLTVIPADKLLISIGSQSSTYGSQTAANLGAAATGTVTAQYCFDASNCNGANLVDLTLTRLSSNQWKAADNTGSYVVFDTSLASSSYSSGGYLNVGNYTYTASEIAPLSLPNGNFNGRATNGGVLTITPLAVNLTNSMVSKAYDGTTSLPASNTTTNTLTATNVQSGDALDVSFVSGSFASSAGSASASFNLLGVQLSGTDASNYSLTNYPNNTYTGTGSITGGGNSGSNTQPIIHPPKPIIPANNQNNGGGSESSGDSSGNPYLLVPNNRNSSADRCTSNNLEACLCEDLKHQEIDQLAICYQPKKADNSPTKPLKQKQAALPISNKG